jgi:hypothetical protein
MRREEIAKSSDNGITSMRKNANTPFHLLNEL